jgi:isocitrate dehydrogenase
MNHRVEPADIASHARSVDLAALLPHPAPAPAAQDRPARIAVAHGDGIGPEIMAACLRIMRAAGAALQTEPVDLGERAFRAGHGAGIDPQAWEVLCRNRVLYKAPITTPQGGGYNSLNVTLRKALGLYANVRPCTAYHPVVATKHPGMDVVIVRENEEDLYAGIEHRQTDEVYQCLKLVSRAGCERVVRYAFEYALAHNRKQVDCFTKDNIMKLTDGLFHRVFDEIGAEYPQLKRRHWIVDAGAAQLADEPHRFDVIVMPNLYGDILSDVGAEIAGSIGLAPSANVGQGRAMFEAVHGSAPPLAGKDLANPSGLLLAGVMMLVHLGQAAAASRVHNAWLRTIEDGIHTFDVYDEGVSTAEVGTSAFADAVIERLGARPVHLAPVHYGERGLLLAAPAAPARAPARARKDLVGVDVFVHWPDRGVDALAAAMQAAENGPLELRMITNRGVKVWPDGLPETLTTDHWRCRYMARGLARPSRASIADLLVRLAARNVDFIKTEHLCTFDGEPGFSLGHGR